MFKWFRKKDPLVGMWDSYEIVPIGKQFALCPHCDSLLGMSRDRFPYAKCDCGFWGEITNFITEEEAKKKLGINDV
jgi:hypothetical protein